MTCKNVSVKVKVRLVDFVRRRCIGQGVLLQRFLIWVVRPVGQCLNDREATDLIS